MPKQHQLIVVSITPNGTPSPWIINGPIFPDDFFEAKKKGTTLLLTVHLKTFPRLKRRIVLSRVVVDYDCATEEWRFSALALVDLHLISRRIQGRLYFEGKKLTGEIIAAIPLPQKYVKI